jgi:serine/threonine protein kinase
MMQKIGSIIEILSSEKKYEILKFLGSGAQGEVYRVKEFPSTRILVLKDLKRTKEFGDLCKRSEILSDFYLSKKDRRLIAPFSIIFNNGDYGHLSELAAGQQLSAVLENEKISLPKSLEILTELAGALNTIHKLNIAHGDIQNQNIFVAKQSDKPFVQIIDWDNFSYPSAPPASCYGHLSYMSPEQRRAARKKELIQPTMSSDVYAFAVIAHELLLRRHPAQRFELNPDSFNNALCKGWPEDPLYYCDFSKEVGGYPISILGVKLIGLLRYSLSSDPEKRPGIDTWYRVLHDSMTRLITCQHCSGPQIYDGTLSSCTYCHKPYPVFVLDFGSRSLLIDDNRTLILGRDELGGSAFVSKRHASISKQGFQLELISYGKNGTSLKHSFTWEKLTTGKPVVLHPKDKVRFADVIATVRIKKS